MDLLTSRVHVKLRASLPFLVSIYFLLNPNVFFTSNLFNFFFLSFIAQCQLIFLCLYFFLSFYFVDTFIIFLFFFFFLHVPYIFSFLFTHSPIHLVEFIHFSNLPHTYFFFTPQTSTNF